MNLREELQKINKDSQERRRIERLNNVLSNKKFHDALGEFLKTEAENGDSVSIPVDDLKKFGGESYVKEFCECYSLEFEIHMYPHNGLSRISWHD